MVHLLQHLVEQLLLRICSLHLAQLEGSLRQREKVKEYKDLCPWVLCPDTKHDATQRLLLLTIWVGTALKEPTVGYTHQHAFAIERAKRFVRQLLAARERRAISRKQHFHKIREFDKLYMQRGLRGIDAEGVLRGMDCEVLIYLKAQ